MVQKGGYKGLLKVNADGKLGGDIFVLAKLGRREKEKIFKNLLSLNVAEILLQKIALSPKKLHFSAKKSHYLFCTVIRLKVKYLYCTKVGLNHEFWVILGAFICICVCDPSLCPDLVKNRGFL